MTKEWTVTITTVPAGRDEVFTVQAVSGVHAIVEALMRYHLLESELSHEITVHCGPPREVPDVEVKTGDSN